MAKNIYKKVVFDDRDKPVEVIISYEQWQEIESTFKNYDKVMRKERLEKYRGILKLQEEPLSFQRRMRNEWG